MAFPSDLGTKSDDLTRAWARARSFAGAIKRDATNLKTLAAAGTAGASDILAFSVRLADAKAELAKSAAVPGIAAYAQEQINDPTLNVEAAFADMATAIDGCIAWIVANFPKDVGGFLLAQTIAADGRPADRVFTAAGTATLRTQLDALITTID
jgi:hypothetical protein